MPDSLFNKVADLKACNFIKNETLAQVFSCEICEISKKFFFKKKTPPMVASVNLGIHLMIIGTVQFSCDIIKTHVFGKIQLVIIESIQSLKLL